MSKHEKVYGVCENKCLVPVYSKEQVDKKVDDFASSHNHDDRYFTETEMITKLNAKADRSALDLKADKTALGTQVTYSLSGTTLTITTK